MQDRINLIHGKEQEGEGDLALAACQTLVECRGGQTWLSRPGSGRGTSVCFTLPLATSPTLFWRREADRERNFLVPGPARGPLTLLAEDEPKIVDKLARILQRHGYRTAFAVTADDGLEDAKRLAPDLITLALGLPVRPGGVLHSGMDLYRALKRDSHLAGIPVILVTGHDLALTQATQTLPPILSKPFRTSQLLDQVATRL